MKIDDPLKKTGGVGLPTAPTRTGKGAEKSTGVAPASAETDSVHLSTTAQSLTQTATGGVFDAQKVEVIKAAIANGTFKVNADLVANGLLESVKDLIGARK